jgi:hypothetical protein
MPNGFLFEICVQGSFFIHFGVKGTKTIMINDFLMCTRTKIKLKQKQA